MAVETNVLMVQWEKRDAKTQKSNNVSVDTVCDMNAAQVKNHSSHLPSARGSLPTILCALII